MGRLGEGRGGIEGGRGGRERGGREGGRGLREREGMERRVSKCTELRGLIYRVEISGMV